MADCTQQHEQFMAANDAAMSAFATETEAADAVDTATLAAADAAAALAVAQAADAQAKSDLVDASAVHAEATTAADAAAINAGQAYADLLACERGGTGGPEPAALFAKLVRRRAKS